MWKLYQWKSYTAYSILKKKKSRKYSRIQNLKLYVYCEYLSTQKIMTSSAILNDYHDDHQLLPNTEMCNVCHMNKKKKENIFKRK